MSSHVAAARLAEFKDAFKLLDKDGDGTISWLEFEGFLRSIGQTPTKQDLEVCAACVQRACCMVFIAMQEAMAEFDADQSGTIDFEEVCGGVSTGRS